MISHIRSELASLAREATSPGFRWVSRRKEVIVEAVRRGALTEEAAQRQFGVTTEELRSWAQRYQVSGRSGLKEKCIQRGRQ